MVNYSNGKIYKIWDNCYNMCYVGSTVQPLEKRFEFHRFMYKKFLEGHSYYVSAFDLFEKYGVKNCKIELVERFNCDNKEDLKAREGHDQRECDCVNKRIEGRTDQQYYQDNKETIKQYYIDNKDMVAERRRIYYENNKEKFRELGKQYKEANKDKHEAYQTQYRIDNKEKINEQKRQHYHDNKEKLLIKT